jgi:hypothetical protein
MNFSPPTPHRWTSPDLRISHPDAFGRDESRNSNAALLLPLFVPVTPLLRYSYKKIGGGTPSSPALPEGFAALGIFEASRETLLIRSLFSPRPFAPLSKSFRINTVTNPPQNPPLFNSFRFNHFQALCKAPLSKSFRIIALQKYGGWGYDCFRRARLQPGRFVLGVQETGPPKGEPYKGGG